LLERLRDADRQHLARLPTYIKRAVMSLVDYLAAPSPAPVIEEIDTLVSELRNKDAIVISGLFHCVPIMGRAADTIDSLRAALVEAENRACHHGWRGTVPDEGRSIQTPCPACGARSLFIGSGGHLTCSRVPSDRSDGCHSPSVEDTVKQLKQRAEQAESALAAAKAGAAPHQNADQPKAAPQAPCTPRRSSPGLAERPDSPNGVSLERAAILDETDSGVKPAGVAPRVGEDEVIEMCAKAVESLSIQIQMDYLTQENLARMGTFVVEQYAQAIRALKKG
jgi:hypothetical protein